MKLRLFCDRCKKEVSIIEDYVNASGEKTVIIEPCVCFEDYVPYYVADEKYDDGYRDGYYDHSVEMK